jgi:hypothetical protein
MIEEVLQWIKHISLKRPELNGFAVCPFAESASYEIIEHSICGISPIEGVDVAIFIVEPYLTSEVLRDYRIQYNSMFPDYEFLEDGMDEPTFLEGIQTNFGKANLMLIQKKDHLEKMRKLLSETDYYSMWDPEILSKIQQSK